MKRMTRLKRCSCEGAGAQLVTPRENYETFVIWKTQLTRMTHSPVMPQIQDFTGKQADWLWTFSADATLSTSASDRGAS